MFTDQIKIIVAAGNGGNGIVAWRREKCIAKGGPYGGNGGDGGSVIIQASHNIFSLDQYRHKRHLKAQHGKVGGPNNRHGANGKDLIIEVPCGTLLKDSETGEILCDFVDDGQTYALCQGGRGGRGNTSFKSSTNQAPNKSTPGRPGESTTIELELKLIADVGFVGMPNAGKSTLLNALANAPCKTAAYPFTTLSPNLSFIEFDDFSRIYIADIPGIIKGAHQNKGLGFAFLKHIERTSVLIYMIDLSGIDGRDPYQDYLTLKDELTAYSDDMKDRPHLILLNKIDAEISDDNYKAFVKRFDGDPKSLLRVSALTGEGLETFIESMRKLAQKDGKRYH